MSAPVRIRIDLAYDGTDFHGYARQRDVRTVQGVLEAALARYFGGAVATTVAGRTDAGVHAHAQTVHADVPVDPAHLDEARVRGALDKLCGPEVTVWAVRRVDGDFDARFGAVQRRYRYRLCDAEAMDPLLRWTTWHLGGPRLDVAAMQAGARHLLGEHDFTSFCRRSGDQHLRRRIDALTVARDEYLLTFDVAGPAFCHQMVRSVVGCLVPVGQRRRAPDAVADILAARDRAAVGRVAPPHGLALTGVTYR